MKRLLIPLLAALALPTAVNADPLKNILRHTLKGGTKEVIRNNQSNNNTFIEKPNFRKPKPNLFGKYGSRYEAFDACNYWKQNNMHLASKRGKSRQEIYSYKCKNEAVSRLYLGIYNWEVIQRYKY